MLAQVLLTPTESKKFIAKAVANLDEVRTFQGRHYSTSPEHQHCFHRRGTNRKS